MNKLPLLLVACALLSLNAARAHRVPAQGASDATVATPAAPARPVGPTGIVLPAADPMAAEMQREIERGQKEYAALFQRLALARNELEAFEIQDDMRQQRVELQVSLLRIQSAYARRSGRNAFANQLERAIEALIAADPPKPADVDPQRRL